MSYTVDAMHDHVIRFGSLVLHFSQYKLTGSCIVREQGTASGSSAVAAVYPKGSRMTLRGRLAPGVSVSMTGQTLCGMMRAGATVPAVIDNMVLPSARLIAFSIEDTQPAPEITVVLFTEDAVTREEDV